MEAKAVLEGFGRLFYVIDPRTTSFDRVEDVPDYISEAIPFFVFTIVLEIVVGFFVPGHRKTRTNDGLTSMAAGMVMQILHKFFLGTVELSSYIWCYNRFHQFDLDVHNIWTWVLGFLAVDCGYYWFHRYGHEINIFWAAHIVHHSSEDYNQTTALRQSALQTYTSFIFYLPAALILPPPMFAAHKHFNTLYQYWIHTELIGKLGPIEWIMNTPSHHRVHHGRNAYCIDHNYAGTLIIWDRMFGTFQEEKDDERVVYGLTTPVRSFDPFWVQFHHLFHVLHKAWTLPGLGNKLSALFYGPGWAPGKPRLGDIKDVPAVKYPHKYYDPKVPSIINAYVMLHYVASLALYVFTLAFSKKFSGPAAIFSSSFVLLSLTSYGAMFDRKRYALPLELARLVLPLAYVGLASFGLLTEPLKVLEPAQAEMVVTALSVFYGASLLFVLGRAALVPKAFLGRSTSTDSMPPALPASRRGVTAAPSPAAPSPAASSASAPAAAPSPKAAAPSPNAATATPKKAAAASPKAAAAASPKATDATPRTRSRAAKGL